MAVDTPCSGFHNPKEAGPLPESRKMQDRLLEDAVSRALRDNLAPLQRTADDLHQAYADLVAACSSSRPTNALPAMLRAQTAAASLAAGLAVLSNFVTVALNTQDQQAPAEAVPERRDTRGSAPAAVAEPVEMAGPAVFEPSPVAEEAGVPVDVSLETGAVQAASDSTGARELAEEAPAFDVAALGPELQDLHRRASRVAKVAMQDIKLLRPKDVRLGREHKDICHRLRSELDKARKEYDRRFQAILDHPVDYFHRWMVEILAEGDREALGEYPYPSPAPRR